MYRYPRAFKPTTVWIQEKVYIVSTDQGSFTVKAQNLDYKETVKEYYKHGYTNVHIAYIGRSV